MPYRSQNLLSLLQNLRTIPATEKMEGCGLEYMDVYTISPISYRYTPVERSLLLPVPGSMRQKLSIRSPTQIIQRWPASCRNISSDIFHLDQSSLQRNWLIY